MFICHLQVHMDVKSPNVLLGRNNLAKLADVGLAKFLHKDYLSVAKSVGTFAWSVSPSDNFELASWRRACFYEGSNTCRMDVMALPGCRHVLSVDTMRHPTTGAGGADGQPLLGEGGHLLAGRGAVGARHRQAHVRTRCALLAEFARSKKQAMTEVVLFGPPQARVRRGGASGPSSALHSPCAMVLSP
jgi:hypothetical protein